MLSRWEASIVEYDPHGDKHFTGQGSQWKGNKENVNEALKQRVTYLRKTVVNDAMKDGGKNKPYTYYYVGDKSTDSNVIEYLNKKNQTFTIQVDYDPDNNKVIFHGYPSNNEKTGFGKTLKNLNLTILEP